MIVHQNLFGNVAKNQQQNYISNTINNMDHQEAQTVEFYKIKLMEKDSEISELTAKFKKIEFKHSRDIKDLKMAEEKAKQSLKQQKLKLDKISKQANQNYEQNQLLQHRLTELKEDKDKEIQAVRAQYNLIKEEVRSYERILPTHTFLTEIGLSIHQIFTYEDIFVNLKEKTSQCQQLKTKIESSQKELSEFQKNAESNEEMLKQKKNEAERSLKELLSKVYEYQSQISDLKSTVGELQQKIYQIQNLLNAERELVLVFKEENKQYQAKIEQMIQDHSQELNHKEQEIKALTMAQFQKYEEEIEFLKNRSENKETMYMNQIGILEDERSEYHHHYQKEKQRYEENILELKEHAYCYKQKFEEQKRINKELAEKNAELRKELVQLSLDKQFLVSQVKSLEIQLSKQDAEGYRQKCQEMQKQNNIQDQQLQTFLSKLHSIQNENKSLVETIEKYENQIHKLEQINNHQSSELQDLKSENRSRVLSLGESNSNDVLHSLRKSIDQVSVPLRKSIEQITLPVTNPESNTLIEEESDKDKITELEKQIQILTIQIDNLKVTEKQFINDKDKMIDLQKQIQTLLTENGNLKLSQKTLTNKQNELQLSANSLTNRVAFSKSKIDSLQSELAALSSQLSKQKLVSKNLKQELKDSKSTNVSTLQKYTKQMKQMLTQNQLLKHQKEKFKADFLLRQKSYIHEIAVLKGELQKSQKNNNRLLKQIEDRAHIESEYQISLQKLKELLKQIQKLKKQIVALEEDNICKDRQNDILNESLARERKERTLRTVPSLQLLQEDDEIQEENFKTQYNTIGQKQAEIYMLNREISDLKEEIEHLKERHNAKIQLIQAEQTEYIQQIIKMKMKVAESQMRAAEKQYLYNQLKKKMANGK